jgi:hypothetical protein
VHVTEKPSRPELDVAQDVRRPRRRATGAQSLDDAAKRCARAWTERIRLSETPSVVRVSRELLWTGLGEG